MLSDSRGGLRVVVDRKHCQQFRELLGDAGLFDKKRKVTRCGERVELPVLGPPQPQLETKLRNIGAGSFDIFTSAEEDAQDSVEGLGLKEKLLHSVAEVVTFSIDCELEREIPESWEYYGDLLLVPGTSFRNPIWRDFLDEILNHICRIFKVTRVARKCPVVNDDFRSPKTDMLRGSSTWVSRKENGITYHFDITKSMFSAGNISEKLRVSKFDCRGETVVDLFAGIGYFTLPFLLHAKADRVIACEWNPASVEALQYNLQHLGLSESCSVLQGDNRLVCPHNVADRVNLGLIPQSEVSWRTACQALRQTGGVLHVHGNVHCSKLQNKREEMLQWAEGVRETLTGTLQEVKGRPFRSEVLHTECVKSYSPRVFHVVADLNFVEDKSSQ